MLLTVVTTQSIVIRVQGLKSRGGDEFSKNFLTPGGGPRVGMIFNPGGGEGSDTNFFQV